MKELEKKYLKALAKQFPNIASATTEIINLESILNLPKGTEHYISDVHGEYEHFRHVIRNGSGSVRKKIEEEFGNTLSTRDKRNLGSLIYYPVERMELVKKEEENMEDWYNVNLHRLIQITKRVSSKYTRSKVRKALPKDFAYVIEELITEKEEIENKEDYYRGIINTIIRIGKAPDFIIAICDLIQVLVVDYLHLVGDIYDRGPGPHKIIDQLKQYKSVDIQWGNHDIVWMGAASGHLACIATVVRIAARYGALDILEDGYGINLIPLVTFAIKTYRDDPCACFKVKTDPGTEYNDHDLELDKRMQKAMSIIQFKLEGQIIKAHPEFNMSDRALLDKIDYKNYTITIDGKEYDLLDSNFPTVDPENPFELSVEEKEVMERVQTAFIHSEKLQRHIKYLFSKGSLYRVHNNSLLYHGCVPLDENGDFLKVNVFGQMYSGKELYDVLELYARKGFYASDDLEEKRKGQDILWYIWTGPNSPVFGKDKMATFERYFLAEKDFHKEKKNPYYRFVDNEEIMKKILNEFGLDNKHAYIVNGHVPVEQSKGQSPVHCDGKLLIIDGGFSKAYQEKTGIAGYTLVANSHELKLVALEPFTSLEEAIRKDTEIISTELVVKRFTRRLRVADTDIGAELRDSIVYLEKLLHAYREGTIVEKAT